MWLVGLVGVFGYTFCKTILNKKFWQYYLPVLVVWDIFITFREVGADYELEGEPYLIAVLIMYILILIPAYVGVYLYGYKYLPKNT